MRYFEGILSALLLFICLPGHLRAQISDSSKATIETKSITGRHPQWTAPTSQVVRLRSFLLPATLIGYGIVSLHADALQDINESVKEEIYTERLPQHTTLDNYLQYAPAAAVYALNLAGVHGKNNFRDRTIIYAMSNIMMGAAVYTGKIITREPRPDGSNNLGFPSGHTATAFAAAEFLRQEYRDVSAWYSIGGYAVAAVTGYLRIQNNKHWVGDVVAGAGVGIISTKLAYWLYPAIKRKLFKDHEPGTMILPSYQNGVLGIGMTRQL